MTVKMIEHPLLRHKVGLMREAGISSKKFRELTAEVGNLLTYEASKKLQTEQVEIKSWTGGKLLVDRIAGKKITIVPILRAGLGLLEGVMQVIPAAKISVVGLYRDEETLQPVPYFDKLVDDISQRMALIVDPMLATGGTLIATIDLLKARGCTRIMGLFLVSAPEGLKAVSEKHPDVDIYTAAIDECLNEQGYIIPGLGDAGDKIFGTNSS